MRIRRLGWAGIEIEADGRRAVIDLLEEIGVMERFVGPAHDRLVAPDPGVDVALVTHLHFDHADPAAIARVIAPGGVLLRPAPADGEGLEVAGVALTEAGLAERDVPARVAGPWEAVEVAGLRCVAVPAVDGFGDPQVSWVVEAGGRRILHAGDTLFHGSWWLIATRHGPFDAVFLPVNGAVVDLPHRRPPSPLAAAMDPRQAAVAAHLLGARIAVPIHYDTLHRPPVYVQVDDPAGAFCEEAAALGVEARVLAPGEALEL